MKTRKIFISTLVLLLAAFLSACNQTPGPQAVVDGWQSAMNAGDIDKALAYLAEDAVVTIIPASDGDGVYTGHAEIHGWYTLLAGGKGVTTLSDCKVEGETIACLDTYTDAGLTAMGVDFIEGDFVAQVREGKIRLYTFTIREESLAKFPAPEVRIASDQAIAGNWVAKSGATSVLHEFRANGVLIVRLTDGYVISTGRYGFENELLAIEDLTGDCQGMIGRYEVYATYEADKPVQLRFVLSGEDACTERKATLDGNVLLPGQPAAAVVAATEPPNTAMDVLQEWADALDKGDIDGALACMAEDAVVTIIPPAEGDGVYSGQAEIRGWYEMHVANKGTATLSGCEVNGETVTCLNTYTDEGLQAMGVDFIEGDFVVTLRDGKIQAYTFTITAESLAKFPLPPEPTVAAGPEATSTLMPEVRITNAEALVGKWEGKAYDEPVHHIFQANGGYVIKYPDSSMNIAISQYWFEDGLMKIGDSAPGDCSGIIGSYEVYGTYEGEKLVKLRFVLVGSDACADRKNAFAGKTLTSIAP